MKDNIKVKKIAKFIKWNSAYKNALPDSAFAAVYNVGDNKIRKLPFKDKDGKVDVPHLRNALVRISQSNIDMPPKIKSKALMSLKSQAKRYLKSYQNTKSGDIMKFAISKFESSVKDKLSIIIKTLKERATNLKPTDEISFDVKKISLLIEDLEESLSLIESMNNSEEKEDSNKNKLEDNLEDDKSKDIPEPKKEKENKDQSNEDKSETNEINDDFSDQIDNNESNDNLSKIGSNADNNKDKSDNQDKHDDDETEEEASKFQEIIKVCEDYKNEVEKSYNTISKLQEEIKILNSEKENLNSEISKFKEESYNKLLDSTVNKVSKFKSLTDEEKLNLKQEYLTSKMSESALEEIGRITDKQMFSKLEEPKQTTIPSEHLEHSNNKTEEFSKMSNNDKLDYLANVQAKKRGFVINN